MKVALVDDHPIVRDALRHVLPAHRPGVEIVGEAGTARDAVALVNASRPDLVMMDLLLPGPNGGTAIRELRRSDHRCRILVYTALKEAAFAVDAFAEGADGYVVKNTSVEELLTAFDAVGGGERYVSPALGVQLDSGSNSSERRGMAALSAREREIFDLIVTGQTNREIAQHLFISPKTVETHRARINQKLGVHSTGQLIRFASLAQVVCA